MSKDDYSQFTPVEDYSNFKQVTEDYSSFKPVENYSNFTPIEEDTKYSPRSLPGQLATFMNTLVSGKADVGLPAPLSIGAPSQEKSIAEREARLNKYKEEQQNSSFGEAVKNDLRVKGDFIAEGANLVSWPFRAALGVGAQVLQAPFGKDLVSMSEDANKFIEQSNPATSMRKAMGISGATLAEDTTANLLSPIMAPLEAAGEGYKKVAGEKGKAAFDLFTLGTFGAGAIKHVGKKPITSTQKRLKEIEKDNPVAAQELREAVDRISNRKIEEAEAKKADSKAAARTEEFSKAKQADMFPEIALPERTPISPIHEKILQERRGVEQEAALRKEYEAWVAERDKNAPPPEVPLTELTRDLEQQAAVRERPEIQDQLGLDLESRQAVAKQQFPSGQMFSLREEFSPDQFLAERAGERLPPEQGNLALEASVQPEIARIPTVEEAAARAYEQSAKDIPVRDFTEAYKKAVEIGQIPSPELQAKLENTQYGEAQTRPQEVLPPQKPSLLDDIYGEDRLSFSGTVEFSAGAKDINVVAGKLFTGPAIMAGKYNPVIRKGHEIIASIVRQTSVLRESLHDRVTPYYELNWKSKEKINDLLTTGDTPQGRAALEQQGYKDWKDVPDNVLAENLNPRELQAFRRVTENFDVGYDVLKSYMEERGFRMPPKVSFYFPRMNKGPFYIEILAEKSDGTSVVAHREYFKTNKDLKAAQKQATIDGLGFESGKHDTTNIYEILDNAMVDSKIAEDVKGLQQVVLDRVEGYKSRIVANKASATFDRSKTYVPGYIGTSKYRRPEGKEKAIEIAEVVQKWSDASVNTVRNLAILTEVREPMLEAKKEGRLSNLPNTVEHLEAVIDHAVGRQSKTPIDATLNKYTEKVSKFVDSRIGRNTGAPSASGRDVTKFVGQVSSVFSKARLSLNPSNIFINQIQPMFAVVELARMPELTMAKSMELTGKAFVKAHLDLPGILAKKVESKLTGKEIQTLDRQTKELKDGGITQTHMMSGLEERIGMAESNNPINKALSFIPGKQEPLTRLAAALSVMDYVENYRKGPNLSKEAKADFIKNTTDAIMTSYEPHNTSTMYNPGGLAKAATNSFNAYLYNGLGAIANNLGDAGRGNLKPILASTALVLTTAGAAGTFWGTAWNSFVDAYNSVFDEDLPKVQEVILDSTLPPQVAKTITFGPLSTATDIDFSSSLSQGVLPGFAMGGGLVDTLGAVQLFMAMTERASQAGSAPISEEVIKKGLGLVPTGPTKNLSILQFGTIKGTDKIGKPTYTFPTKKGEAGYTLKDKDVTNFASGFRPLDMSINASLGQIAARKEKTRMVHVERVAKDIVNLANANEISPLSLNRALRNIETTDYPILKKAINARPNKYYLNQNIRAAIKASKNMDPLSVEHVQNLVKYGAFDE